ncbi:hypothetical protein IEQ34_018344 [Dendrobium chrysotoxum]|uniref:SnoaL-like domain-containing protein n=1 Tax=Dendrobium chrysotoxum TaxID=161865 RepID=A0AAV7FW90_DENCH|nr:hypothetical protein IEQ34_018344 [Dendrobium chrysotoxum]
MPCPMHTGARLISAHRAENTAIIISTELFFSGRNITPSSPLSSVFTLRQPEGKWLILRHATSFSSLLGPAIPWLSYRIKWSVHGDEVKMGNLAMEMLKIVFFRLF